MFETEKDFKSLSMTSYFPCKQNDSALKHVGNSSVEQEVELEDTDSDVIDKTDSNMDEDINVKCIHNSKHTSDVKQNCTDVSQIGLQDISYQKRDHHKLQANKEIINQISALFKGPQNRGSNTHQWSSATGIQQTDSERHNETSQYIRVQVAEGKLNTEPLLQNYMKQREEQTTEKNSGMLDSITNSTQRVGSWFVGDTSQSANGNQNGSDGRGSSGVVGSANSFEYFPGHVYENNTSAVDTDLYQNTSTEDSSSESAQSHPSTGFVDNKFKKIVDKFWGSSNSLAADLEKSIALLKDISNLKLYNPAIKKKLVRQVVNKLIETNYAEDNALLESYVPAVPPVSHINPSGFVSDTVQVSQDGMSGGCKARRTMEREEVSGESANEQQGSSNILLSHHPATPSAASFIPEKCVGTSKALLPETSQMPSTSGSIPSTTQGCSCCSSTNTTLTRNGYAWKESPTQSEKEYEQRMHKPRHCGNKEVLLNVCEMERKSQLSWIHTEIRHLCNLKQLLEKPRCLRNSHLDRGMQTQKGNQRRRRNPITSENSEVSTEPESLSFRSDAACSSSANETHVKESENEHNTLTKLCHCKHTDQILELRSFKDPRKHGGTDQFGPEILHNPSDPHMKTASSNRGDISTKFPTSVVLCGKKDEHKLQLKEKAIQAPTSSNASTNGDMSVFMGDTLSESMAAGRINVFVQAVERQSTTEKDSLESEVSDINKNTIKASKSNEHGEITMKQPELNDCIPLCCCECQKLLTDIKLNKQRSVDKVSVDAHDKSSGAVGRWKYISSSRRTQSKNVEDSSARYHTLSSSGPLGGAVELTPDLHDVASSVSTETVRSIGVQTTQLVNSLPLRQPHSHSLYARWIEKKKSKAEKDMDASLKECPCCGILEDQTDVISESSNDNNCEWKCSRCLKMEQDQKRNRKCQICGTLESQLQMSHEDDISDHDINAWKCTDCIARESGNAEPGFDICIHCGLQKDCRTINTSSSKTKAPIGYVLTVETTTDSVSSMEESSEEKLLKEVKVSERKRHPVSAKGRRRGKLKRVVLESNIKSCSKGNEKPVGSMKNRSSNEDGFQRNRLYRREPTLQEYLIINRPDFIQSAEYRRQCLDELVYLRELRQKSRQKVLALACHRASFADGGSAASVNTGPLPPPPLDQKKMFSHRTMRAQTERKYHNLPEVLSKKVEKKRKEDYRTNRLMAEIFARKLQKRVLKGDVNLSSSRRVISII